jgi:pimeloyl-ACP methyl ester carboxylesterase
MADRLPRARLLIMTGGSHAGMVEQPDLIDSRVREFLVHELHEPEKSVSSRLKAQA